MRRRNRNRDRSVGTGPYQTGKCSEIKYVAPRHMLYPEIDSDVWMFFCDARSKGIPVNGPMLQNEANEFALKHKCDNFSASNGWLKSFCVRHQIRFSLLHGENAEISADVVQKWMQELPNIIKDYQLKDIYNCDETSIFFKALPKKSLLGPNEKCEV